MDMQAPPAIIVIKSAEKHDVKEEMTEYVSRLLCRAEGCNPDEDVRCGPSKPDSIVIECNLVAMKYPTYLRWWGYRERAETLIKNLYTGR